MDPWNQEAPARSRRRTFKHELNVSTKHRSAQIIETANLIREARGNLVLRYRLAAGNIVLDIRHR